MFDTVSLFDSMEQDDTQRRVASRRALALAHHRIESSVGRFLRGARNEEEFFERLGLVQDDFASHIHSASAEVGHEHPEHIAAALRDHYRLAADGNVEFVKPADEEEEEDEGKTASGPRSPSGRLWTPRVAGPNAMGVPFGHQQPSPELPPSSEFSIPQDNRPVPCPGCGLDHMGPGQYCRDCDPASAQQGYSDLMQEPASGPLGRGAGKQAAPAPYPRERGPYPTTDTDPITGPQGWDIDNYGPTFFDQQGHGYGPAEQQAGFSPDPGIRNQEGYIGPGVPKDVARDEGYETQPVAVNPELQPGQTSQRDYGNDQGLQIGPNLPGVQVPRDYPNRYQGSGKQGSPLAPNPALQQDTSQQQVTCPECGGANPQCPKCHGMGKVQNFGPSVLDAVAKTAEDQNNTGLGGPEPKMDKSQGPGSKPDVPGKIKEKDILVPVGPPKNDGELEEIGDTEHKDLPSNKDDAGFDTGGVDSAPHTKTFPKGDQATPVTRESLSNTNPLIDMLGEEWPSDTVVEAAFRRI